MKKASAVVTGTFILLMGLLWWLLSGTHTTILNIITVLMGYGLLLYFYFTRIDKASAGILRGWVFSMCSGHICKGLSIAQGVEIHNPRCIFFGAGCSIGKGASFFPLGQGNPSRIEFGNHVCVGDFNRFASMSSVSVGNDVLFAAFVHITDHSHEYRDISLPVLKQGVFSKGPVRIGDGVWLGYACEVLSGVTIGEHSVVAARAVVTHDVPSFSVVAGCPARVIKQYDPKLCQWIDVQEGAEK